jgi:hypothetical protein
VIQRRDRIKGREGKRYGMKEIIDAKESKMETIKKETHKMN